ncbi:MAG: hypothetical protein ACLP8X_13665 [Streptosporangiaceae bacterium]
MNSGIMTRPAWWKLAVLSDVNPARNRGDKRDDRQDDRGDRRRRGPGLFR